MAPKEMCSRNRRSARIAAALLLPLKSKKDVRHFNQQMATTATPKIVAANDDEICSILILNDDCLLEVFAHLELEDLCAIKDCCGRLSDLVDSIAVKRFRKMKYVCLPNTATTWWYKKNLMQTALVLEKFGKFITHLCIDNQKRFVRLCNRFRDDGDFVSMMKHCVSLKCLRLIKVDLWEIPSFGKLKPIFQNIRRLELKNCTSDPWHITALLRASKKLKHLIMDGSTTPVSDALCSAIVRYGQNLETIRFKRKCKYDVISVEFFEFMQGLRQLKKLKSLEICNIRNALVVVPAINILAASESLEKLRLSRFIPNDDFFVALRKFTKLKECKLHTDTNLSDAASPAACDFVVTVDQSEIATKNYPYTITITRQH